MKGKVRTAVIVLVVLLVLVAVQAVLISQALADGPFPTLWKAECPVFGQVVQTPWPDGSTGVLCQVWDGGRSRRPAFVLWQETCPVFGWVWMATTPGGTTAVFCDVWD